MWNTAGSLADSSESIRCLWLLCCVLSKLMLKSLLMKPQNATVIKSKVFKKVGKAKGKVTTYLPRSETLDEISFASDLQNVIYRK